MTLTLHVVAIVVCSCWIHVVTSSGKPPITKPAVLLEFCEAETFRAECPAGRVVVMKHARYGRMRAGRCVLRDYGYVGCAANVLPHMDHMCSGRQSCEVRIPDTALDSVNPCPGDFKTYLEAKYECVQAMGPDCRQCSRQNKTLLPRGVTSGYVSSVPVLRTHHVCDSALCPVVLEEESGKRLNVTLLDFSFDDSDASEDKSGEDEDKTPQEDCHRYGSLREPDEDSSVYFCAGDRRERHLYTTRTNRLEIQINNDLYGEPSHFLLSYTVFGCKDPDTPPDAWLKRNDNHVTIGCMTSAVTYELTCYGNEWVGAIGMCPPGAAQVKSSGTETEAESNSIGMMVAIAVGIALVIGSCIVTVGLVYVRNRRGLSRRRERPLVDVCYSPSHGGDLLHKYPHYCSPPALGPFYQAIIAAKENDYEYNMELRPLPTVPGDRRMFRSPGDAAGLPVPQCCVDPTQDGGVCLASTCTLDRYYLKRAHPASPSRAALDATVICNGHPASHGSESELQTFRPRPASAGGAATMPRGGGHPRGQGAGEEQRATAGQRSPVRVALTQAPGHVVPIATTDLTRRAIPGVHHYFELDPDEVRNQTVRDRARSATLQDVLGRPLWVPCGSPEELQNTHNVGKETGGHPAAHPTGPQPAPKGPHQAPTGPHPAPTHPTDTHPLPPPHPVDLISNSSWP